MIRMGTTNRHPATIPSHTTDMTVRAHIHLVKPCMEAALCVGYCSQTDARIHANCLASTAVCEHRLVAMP